MSRHWMLLVLLLLPASALQAQEVVLVRETPLYERPTQEATVRATLPVGLRLTLNTRQGEWLAVTTSEGLIGWIPRSVAHVEDPSPPADATPASISPPPAAAENRAPQPQASSSEASFEPLGFYNRRKRSAISFATASLHSSSISSAGSARRIGLSWATMRGRRFEGGAFVGGSRYDLNITEYWYDLQVGGRINLFILQPHGVNPFGLYGGGLLAWTTYYLGKNVTAKVNTLHYGGEGGAYLHLGRKPAFIPRAALRIERVSYLGSDEPPGYVVSEGVARVGTLTSVLLGLDVSFGGVVPGLWVTSRDGERAFVLRVTLAY